MNRVLSVFLLSTLLFSVGAAPSPTTEFHYLGMTLEAALRQLQMQGLNVVFSSDLVHPEMKVMREPFGSPQDILQRLVGPHGLTIQQGPQDTLLVVPKPRELQEAPAVPEERSTPKTGETVVVPFVTIAFTALDEQSRPVKQLKADDFILLEDGKTQTIVDLTYSGENRQPITFFFLLDSSFSMRTLQDGTQKYDVSKQILLRLLGELQPQDRMMVIGFHERPWTISEMTDNREIVRQAVLAEKAGPARTGLYDALTETLRIAEDYPGRRIIVLFSDGQDNFSRTSLEDALALLKFRDVTVWAFGMRAAGESEEKGPKVVKSISEMSGGIALFVSRASDADGVIAQVRDIMGGQYIAGYVPPQPLLYKRREVRLHCFVPGVRLSYRRFYLF